LNPTFTTDPTPAPGPRAGAGKKLAVAAAFLAAALSPGRAAANPRPLPFTYPWETLSQGEAEVEQYVDVVPLRALDGSGDGRAMTVIEPRYELQTEIEYGITDRLELGLYLVAKSAPEEQGAGSPLAFDGLKQRLRYRIGNEGQLPVDMSIYFEVSEMHDELELEEKLNLQKRFGRLKLLANLWVEQSFVRGGAVDFVLHPTGGLTYQVTPNVWTGAEYWMQAIMPLTAEEQAPAGSVAAFNAHSHHFAGPALAFVWDKLWWSTGAYARLDEATRPMQVGDAFGHFYARTVIGLEF
jgi:hypothetical protein